MLIIAPREVKKIIPESFDGKLSGINLLMCRGLNVSRRMPSDYGDIDRG